MDEQEKEILMNKIGEKLKATGIMMDEKMWKSILDPIMEAIKEM